MFSSAFCQEFLDIKLMSLRFRASIAKPADITEERVKEEVTGRLTPQRLLLWQGDKSYSFTS